MPASPTTGQLLRVLVALVSMSCLSQFFRVSQGVIAPELMRELSMSPQELGFAGGAFFIMLLAMQIPVGIWFDRHGARVTQAALAIFIVACAVLVARAQSAGDLIVARTVMGLGCAASFMALVFVLSKWVEPARYTTVLSWGFGLSNIGTIAATAPMAWAASTIGWRNSFLCLAVISAAAAITFWTVVRDRPPGSTEPPARPEPLAAVLAGLMMVWRTPGLVPVLAMHTFASGTQLTVLAIWAGPYLNDLYGLDGIARGKYLLLMGLAQVAGIFSYGPLDRLVGSRKKVIVSGALATITILAVLAVHTRPQLWLAVTLLTASLYLGSYSVVIVSQGRALFPP
ncbi:MAG: MFS transporter, partial [Pirellulales bacterium]|nr:MFS transporter [Pirellulales bacterium]